MTTPTAIGIDFGTTKCCVGVWQNGRVEIVPDEQGRRTTPSFVSFSGNERIVGEPAKFQSALAPHNTVFNVKRFMGRKFDDSPVRGIDRKHYPFATVYKGGNRAYIQVGKYPEKLKVFSPEEITALMFTKLKENAEAYLGKPVTDAVISVPAFFNDSQRRAIKTAGAIAGLNVLRLLNEPTATAITYSLDKKVTTKAKVVIVDFGGGTLDVSLVNIDDSNIEVKATSGHTRLGGEDFDDTLVEYYGQVFYERGLKKDIYFNHSARRRLRDACEQAKRALSSVTQTIIEVEFDDHKLYSVVTRICFEQICYKMFLKTTEAIQKVLADSGTDKADVQEIILVGGSTRIPCIVKLVTDFFDGKVPCTNVNRDEAVACGAAIQAAVLSGDASCPFKRNIVDVTSQAFSFQGARGRMERQIERNTPIPQTIYFRFHVQSKRSSDNFFHVGEGDAEFYKDTNVLAQLELVCTPLTEYKCIISFRVDADGIFEVDYGDAMIDHLSISQDNRHFLEEEVERMAEEAKRLRNQELSAVARNNAKNDFESRIYDLRYSVDHGELANELDSARKIDLRHTLRDALVWLNGSKARSKEEYEKRQKELDAMADAVKRKDSNISPDMTSQLETTTGQDTVVQNPSGIIKTTLTELPERSGIPIGEDDLQATDV